MKKNFLLMTVAFLICVCTKTSLHAQRQINISGKTAVGSVLTFNTNAENLAKIEWKKDGQTISALTGSPRNGVTVAGGNGPGNAPNQLYYPNSVFVDREDNLWVADYYNARVQKFAPGSTNGITIGGNLPNRPGSPVNVFVCPEGAVYVADYFGSRVVRLGKNGKKWTTVASGMDLTRGVWVDKHGNVYCTDYGNSRVLKFAPHSSVGVVVAGGHGYGNALNQFNGLSSVMLDDDGNMYIADGLNDRVMRWAPGATEGVIVAGGNGRGNANNQCPLASHAFVDKSKNIYVSNQNAPYSKIQKWPAGATEGKTIAGGNGEGDAANQLYNPFGIFVDGKYLFVADSYNHRIQRFDLSSNTINPEFTATQPGTYTAVATYENGSTAVSNSINVSAAVAKEIGFTKSFAYPNPAKNAVTVNYTAQKSSKYTFEITAVDGKVLLHQEVNAMQGNNHTTIDVSRFAKGIYFINIIRPDKIKESIKLSKE